MVSVANYTPSTHPRHTYGSRWPFNIDGRVISRVAAGPGTGGRHKLESEELQAKPSSQLVLQASKRIGLITSDIPSVRRSRALGSFHRMLKV